MSEVTSRSSASRGRGSGRGGRGGFAGRGGRRPNGSDKPDHSDSPAAFDDDADLGELRKLYGDKTSVIREMFPDWSEADVLFALQETNGDQSEAVTRIAEGTISQWGEVSKTKKPARTKAKDAPAAASTTNEQTTAPRAARGGRTVSEGGRGRGRATERGGRGGAPRGRTAQPSTNGATRSKENQQLSVPTEESSAWGETKIKADPVETKPVTELPASQPAAAAAKTWASMLRQSTAVDKPAPLQGHPKSKPAEAAEPAEAPQALPTPAPAPAPAAEDTAKTDENPTPVATHADLVIEEPALPPPKDDLTETNLEQVIDDSQPAATGTAASTAADSWDPRQSPISSNATPLSAAHQQHQRAPISGYAASALKATTDRTSRPPGFQRRVLDQEEAVRMPGNREVDRAAVQFGAFNLGESEEDIDGEREDAETRGQPPADSPVTQPRTSLPPPVAQPSAVPDTFPKTAAPGAAPSAQIPTQPAQPAIPGQQYGRLGQDPTVQKPIDPFGQQTPASQPPFDSFPATTQAPSQGAFSSAPSDYSNYYTANNQQDRSAYHNYYTQQYGQQQVSHGQHDAQQRPLGSYNAAQADSLSQYPQSAGSHGQPRFGVAADNQNSGHSTPNPAAQAQQQIPQGQQAQPGQQGQAGTPGSQPQGHGQQYPGYNHPSYYPYYHQYYSGYGQGNFGPYGKGGMYGQPYGVSPNAPYDHASSPGNFAPSNAHRDNSASSGLGEYGRGGAGQTGSQPGLGGAGFGGSHDGFARGGSAFQSQAQGFNSQNQPGAGASTGDDLKPFGDGKGAPGPSPSLGGARPGSATNTGPGGQASGLPPQNSQMSGAYGGYPNHLQGHAAHGSGAYGMGAGGAGANQHGNTPYGSYGNQGFGSGGYYGANQQQRGWGGNYH
ncbi:UBA-like protein [Cordyceps fumosorosea ARSEF 2679]|uniref:RNA polymerase II degradation factor 1 n=1 Tax=Cordyceps fumosorosea (strain ARSEF 2679) TaxID=1081104 RepID=A0A168DBN5_CORFA|nr:UBA-like protein [Cordyceps fumosorosea ARSEF 2679]OAA72407.1 UBA-like protein [Cordyceps fumosorosea ARSEF 2679]